jgi:hypothetical protein
MVVRNPSSEIAKLREHLAAADKQLVFLFGAGTSAAVRGTDGDLLIPAVERLTLLCKQKVRELGATFEGAWDRVIEELPSAHRTIEDVLSAVRQKSGAMGPTDVLLGLSPVQMHEMERVIRTTIGEVVNPPGTRVPATLPHDSLANWVNRIERRHAVEMFTTNYDTLIERAFEGARAPIFDGFVGARHPFFFPASLRFPDAAPANSWSRLWKVHGSITWRLENKEITRGEESSSGEMILPSLLKYDESRKQPYIAMLDRLRDVLNKREDGVLIACGFSFADQHINEIVFEALAQNARLHTFALCFDDPSATSELMKATVSHSNLVVLAPSFCVVGGETFEWEVPSAALAKTMTSFTRWPADYETNFNSASGKLTIGDFNVLAGLLDLIVNAK